MPIRARQFHAASAQPVRPPAESPRSCLQTAPFERRQLLPLNDVTTSSPPVRTQAPCVYRKIATRLKRDGAVVRNPPTKPRLSAPTQRSTKEKTYFVFNDIDLKRVEGSVCPHRRAHQLHPLLNFTLAPRNAGRIVAPE